MDKEFNKSLITLFDWYDLAGSKEMLERSAMDQLVAVLSRIGLSLERLYFLEVKKGEFERHFRKVRKIIFYVLNNLFIADHRNSSKETLTEVINMIEDFLEKIDGHFATYLRGNDQLSKRQLMSFQRDLAISLSAEQTTSDKNTTDILNFLKMIVKEHLTQNPTFGELKEVRKAIKAIKQHTDNSFQHLPLTWLDTGLILSDFCEGRYLNILFERIRQGIDQCEPRLRKSCIESLRQYLVKLKASSLTSSRRRNRTIELMQVLIDRHLAIEEEGSYDLRPWNGSKTLGTMIEKITCNLSADQLALILRAMDDSRLVDAKSMNAVFRQIMPFLRTARKEHLSFGAVRSKAYSPEENDRQVTLSMLEKMIEKIKNY